MVSFSISFWPFLSSSSPFLSWPSSGFLKELFFLSLTLRKKNKEIQPLGCNNKAYYSRLIVMKTWNSGTIFGQERQQPATVPTKVSNTRRPIYTDASPALALAAADAILSFQRRRNHVLQWRVRLADLSLGDELDVNAVPIWRDIVTWHRWRWLLPDTDTQLFLCPSRLCVFLTCLDDIKASMALHFLNFNEQKTQVMPFGPNGSCDF